MEAFTSDPSVRLTYSYIHTNYSGPHTFTLIDTVYRDLTGPVVHTLRTLPTP